MATLVSRKLSSSSKLPCTRKLLPARTAQPLNLSKNASFPASCTNSLDCTLDHRLSHPLDDEEHGSPPAAKKRRTGFGSEDISIQPSYSEDQQGPGHKIEEELATALGEGIVHTLEPTGHTRLNAHSSEVPQDGTPNVNPDVASMISEIMDHTERQEQTVAMGPQEIPASNDFQGARGYAFLKANSHLKIQSLPILDNLVSLHDPDVFPRILTLFKVDANSFVPL